MFGKPPITALQEYCAKKHLSNPVYECIQMEDGSKSFVCRVQAMDCTAEGVGRSKKEARHDAAAHLIKKIKKTHPDIQEIPQAVHEAIPISDAVINLRDHCIQQDYPLPTFTVIQQAGPPESPEFTVECKLASIVRFATATTKKAAKQKAAQKLIDILHGFQTRNETLEVANINLNGVTEEEESKIRRKFKTYREYIESDVKDVPGTLLSDRHKYFASMIPEQKTKVESILADDSYLSDKEQALQILKALSLKHTIHELPGYCAEGMFVLELLCDFDAVFYGSKTDIYGKMLDYFTDMII